MLSKEVSEDLDKIKRMRKRCKDPEVKIALEKLFYAVLVIEHNFNFEDYDI